MTVEELEALAGLHEQVLAKIGPALVSGALAEGAVMRIDEIAQAVSYTHLPSPRD